MNRKKTLSILIVSIMILSTSVLFFPSIIANQVCTVDGYVYIDDVIMEPDQIILSFPEQDIKADLWDDGFYIVDFAEEVGETGIFLVDVYGETYTADVTITVIHQIHAYEIDLHVDTIENNPPNEPDNPDPKDNEQNVDLNPDLNVDVSDPDGDPMDVSFYNASDDSLIDTDHDVDSGDTATVQWTGLDYNTEYEWYAIADDSEDETQSDTWSFKTKKEDNNPPNKPDNPTPSDGAEDVDINPDLSVDVSDPDGDPMDVSFYNASDDSLIDTDNDVNSGDTATVQWTGLSYNTEYSWYAIADDGEFENNSNTWSFTTEEHINHPPNKPDNPTPTDGAEDVDINPYLSVDVSDPDGDTMDVSFYNASDDSLIDTDNNVPNGGTATVQWTELSYNTEYSWYTIADDGEYQNKSDTWSFTTTTMSENRPPAKLANPSPEDGAENVDINPDLSVDVTDPDGDNMDVRFYNASDDSLINTDNDVNSGDTATVQWTGLSYNTEYSWYAVADDGEYTTQSDTWSFTTEDEVNTHPTVNIIKPAKGVYFKNKKIFPILFPRLFRFTLIIGDITVEAEAEDPDGDIEKVEFYINGKLKGRDVKSPYSFEWYRDRRRLCHFFVIKVVAYDNDGATDVDRMIVRKIL